MQLVSRHAGDAGFDEAYAGLLAAQDALFALGVTSWQDAGIADGFGVKGVYDAYVTAATRGDLLARVVGALWWERDGGAEQIDGFVQRRAEGSVGRFRPSTVKIMQDGVAENFTAAMTEDYLDGCGCPTHNSGLSFIDPVLLREHVVAARRGGLPGALPRPR